MCKCALLYTQGKTKHSNYNQTSRTPFRLAVSISDKTYISNLTGNATKTCIMAFAPSKMDFGKEISSPHDWVVCSSIRQVDLVLFYVMRPSVPFHGWPKVANYVCKRPNFPFPKSLPKRTQAYVGSHSLCRPGGWSLSTFLLQWCGYTLTNDKCKGKHFKSYWFRKAQLGVPI